MSSQIRRRAPGLVLLVLIAGLAVGLGQQLPLVTPLILAIVFGAILANTVGVPRWAGPGIAVGSILLEIGIVLLGAQLPLDPLIRAGPVLLGLVVTIVVIGIAFVTVLSRKTTLNDRLGSLLAAGSSICGVSAIAAVAPVCDADDSQIAHAAATIVLFDAITLVTFPALGHFFDIGPRIFGIWVGLAMFSTGPVVAAGFAFSPVAGQWATVTKLARNAFIGVVAVWYSLQYAGSASEGYRKSARTLVADFPWFLLGFAALVVVANAGLLAQPTLDGLASVSDVLFVLAFAGLGAEMDLQKMRRAGTVPVAVVGANLVVVGAVAFGLLWLVS
jgi:uncharacterized integral membrane protein (TIGR00698 family)